ncbi:myosin heavy chain, skeletal muscle-like [Orussus abietinus]|uniref:myosin heavy chain, skeletal muscle-like n=1 Tax=Orussus abietinus TaxID=222816 RepID=UPI000626BC57|nr:myosin heavy chain, skeletal muscle-like [Orussus abietinus]
MRSHFQLGYVYFLFVLMFCSLDLSRCNVESAAHLSNQGTSENEQNAVVQGHGSAEVLDPKEDYSVQRRQVPDKMDGDRLVRRKRFLTSSKMMAIPMNRRFKRFAKTEDADSSGSRSTSDERTNALDDSRMADNDSQQSSRRKREVGKDSEVEKIKAGSDTEEGQKKRSVGKRETLKKDLAESPDPADGQRIADYGEADDFEDSRREQNEEGALVGNNLAKEIAEYDEEAAEEANREQANAEYKRRGGDAMAEKEVVKREVEREDEYDYGEEQFGLSAGFQENSNGAERAAEMAVERRERNNGARRKRGDLNKADSVRSLEQGGESKDQVGSAKAEISEQDLKNEDAKVVRKREAENSGKNLGSRSDKQEERGEVAKRGAMPKISGKRNSLVASEQERKLADWVGENSRSSSNLNSRLQQGRSLSSEGSRSKIEESKSQQAEFDPRSIESKDDLPQDMADLDMEVKENESDEDYERRVEQQIQRKIDSIKEEIKREVEKKQKIRVIEENNAKYDEMRSQEDEDEDSQSLDAPNERQAVSKRSVRPGASKRATSRRSKRRAALTGGDLDADLLQENEADKAPELGSGSSNSKPENIHKRSAPLYSESRDETSIKVPAKKRSVVRKVTLVEAPSGRELRKRHVAGGILIPEQAHAKIEDELPRDLTLDPKLRLDLPMEQKPVRRRRSVQRFGRRRRMDASTLEEPGSSISGYRPQDDEDENDDGNEFDDDGFEDRTSNLRGGNQRRMVHPRTPEVDHQNFLFPVEGGSQGLRHKREEMSRESGDSRGKRQVADSLEAAKSLEPVASLIGSSVELSPRLATEYKEAFGGLQGDPGGALVRYKRIKRVAPVS